MVERKEIIRRARAVVAKYQGEVAATRLREEKLAEALEKLMEATEHVVWTYEIGQPCEDANTALAEYRKARGDA
jgi:hypothetical protein